MAITFVPMQLARTRRIQANKMNSRGLAIVSPKAARTIMDRTKVAKSLNSQPAIDDGVKLSRRDMLVGIGLVSVCTVAMPTLLASSPAEASSAPAIPPEAAVDPAKSDADHDRISEHDLAAAEASEPLELSARRRYWRYRYWRRRRYWRPRYWRRRRYWRYRYWRPRYRRRRYWRYRY